MMVTTQTNLAQTLLPKPPSDIKDPLLAQSKTRLVAKDCGCDKCKVAKEMKEVLDKDATAGKKGDDGSSSDTTHITVTTADNQSVTIDMPMQEPKRVTVRKNSTVVEDRDFVSVYKEQPTPAPAPTPDKPEEKKGE